MISPQIQTAAYVFASILFILSLGGLSSQESAKKGVVYGIIGMTIAILSTILGQETEGHSAIIVVILLASVIGILVAKRVQMTSMPQLVAILHSFVGLAAVLVGFGSYLDPKTKLLSGAEHHIHLIEIFLGVFIGAITFTGSVVAWGKLEGRIRSKPLLYKGRHIINIGLLVFSIGLGVFFVNATGESGLLYLSIMTIIALFLGTMLVMAIGGADMPVVVSMLNSYSGWAAAAAGFMLGNDLLIITGALVGSSGAILSIIMCRAMNRSFWSVIFGGFGDSPKGELKAIDGVATAVQHKKVAELLQQAKKVVITPGYGMAVARAQFPVAELVNQLQQKGKQVHFAIHPVAGRLPGHMNVLLAEANVPYDIVFEMEEINETISDTDIVLVIGANDIVNPGAIDDEASPIYGMPVIQAWEATKVIVMKRSMATGYAGVQNPLFFKENTAMLYGDAKESVQKILQEL